MTTTPQRIKEEHPEQKTCIVCEQLVKKRFHTVLWCEPCDHLIRLHHKCSSPKQLWRHKVKCPKCNDFYDTAFINWLEKPNRIHMYKTIWERMENRQEELS